MKGITVTSPNLPKLIVNRTRLNRQAKFTLNHPKQIDRKLSNLNSMTSIFSSDALIYKDSGRSASIKTDAITMKKFIMLLEQLYGDEWRGCRTHDNTDSYIYEYFVTEDQGGALVEAKVVTKIMIGSTPTKFASLHAYNTTDLIHIQGSKVNVQLYLQTHMNSLMELTRCTQVGDISNVNCLQCQTPYPSSIQQNDQLEITLSPPHHPSSVVVSDVTGLNAPLAINLSPLHHPASIIVSDVIDLSAPTMLNLNFSLKSTDFPAQLSSNIIAAIEPAPSLIPRDLPESIIQEVTSPDTGSTSNIAASAPVTVPVNLHRDTIPTTPVTTKCPPSNKSRSTPNTPSHVISRNTESLIVNKLCNRVGQLEDTVMAAKVSKHELDNSVRQVQTDLANTNKAVATLRAENRELRSRLKVAETTTGNLNKYLSELQNKFSKLSDQVEINRQHRAEQSVRAKQTDNNETLQRLQVVEKQLQTQALSQKSNLSARPKPPAVSTAQRPPTPAIDLSLPTAVTSRNPVRQSRSAAIKNIQTHSYAEAVNQRSRSSHSYHQLPQPLMNIADFPLLATDEMKEAKWNLFHKSKNVMIGGSNLFKILPIIKNRTENIEAIATSGATFQSMHSVVLELPKVDLLILQGGTNDADQRDNPSDAIPDLETLILAAKSKARQVILVPPPPINDRMKSMERIMSIEASRMEIDCIVVSHLFPTKGPHLFQRDGLHCTKRGSGIYGLAVIDFLKTWTTVIGDRTDLSCIACHRSGHDVALCDRNNTQNPHNTRPDYPAYDEPRYMPHTRQPYPAMQKHYYSDLYGHYNPTDRSTLV